ncbi:MAG TPA: VOC family protein [Verrucomicrobiae bacterium]|nr:VOC family protein [Verrucomicrobiae bacterium]
MAKLDAIGIVNADIAKSMRFYRLLGLDFPDSAEDHIEATAPNGMRVMLDKLELIKQLDPDWVQPVGRPIGLAFLCGSPKEVDETYAKVTKAGFRGKTPPFDAFWSQRYATVFDPDGNGVDLFAELPQR